MFHKWLWVIACVFCLNMYAFAEELDAEIHNELRNVMKQIETAINSGKYDDMLPVLSENIRATPINQEFLTNHQAVSEYFNKWFGKDGYLKKLEIQFNADALTELSADKTWGTVYGSGKESYVLADGRKFVMQTRWTATVAKEADGKWRIRSIHVGTNFLDNPILAIAENSAKYFAAGGVLLGLLLGTLGTWIFMRRRKA